MARWSTKLSVPAIGKTRVASAKHGKGEMFFLMGATKAAVLEDKKAPPGPKFLKNFLPRRKEWSKKLIASIMGSLKSKSIMPTQVVGSIISIISSRLLLQHSICSADCVSSNNSLFSFLVNSSKEGR